MLQTVNPNTGCGNQNLLDVPMPLLQRKQELEQLIVENPVNIPIPELAKFLDIDAGNLRSSIEQGKCPFGISWQKGIGTYRAFKVPTLTFYCWYTQSSPHRWLSEMAGKPQ